MEARACSHALSTAGCLLCTHLSARANRCGQGSEPSPCTGSLGAPQTPQTPTLAVNQANSTTFHHLHPGTPPFRVLSNPSADNQEKAAMAKMSPSALQGRGASTARGELAVCGARGRTGGVGRRSPFTAKVAARGEAMSSIWMGRAAPGGNRLQLARAATALEDLSRSSHVRGGEGLWENAIGPGRAAAGRKFPQQRRPSARGLSCVKFRGLHK